MDSLITVLSWLCLVTGGFLGITGAVGLFRFPDFYTRLHAASITDTLCVVLIVLGLILQADSLSMIIKLVLVILVLTYTSPTSAYALAKSARHSELEPVLRKEGE